MANVLKSGKMPAPARIVQEDIVGPSLGQVDLQGVEVRVTGTKMCIRDSI